MKPIAFNELEVEIIKAIHSWVNDLLKNEIIHVDEIDAGDARSLASTIATEIIGHGIGIVGKWEVHTKLSEGWDETD